MFKLIFFTL